MAKKAKAPKNMSSGNSKKNSQLGVRTKGKGRSSASKGGGGTSGS